MKKVIIVYGLIAGSIVTALMWFSMFLWNRGVVNFDNGEYFGYGSMLIALSMVFFGIKSYRDNQSNRSIGFWKGIQIGLLISLLASVMYAGGWEAYVRTTTTGAAFLDNYIEHTIAKLKEKGTAQEEVDRFTGEMATIRELYKNPFIRFGMTMTEILPVGIIVTLLSAAILRRKEVLAE